MGDVLGIGASAVTATYKEAPRYTYMRAHMLCVCILLNCMYVFSSIALKWHLWSNVIGDDPAEEHSRIPLVPCTKSVPR